MRAAVCVGSIFIVIGYGAALSAEVDREFHAEVRVDFHNFLAAKPEKPSARVSVVVSNSCWLMRMTPLSKVAYEYQEAAFDGQTLYYLEPVPKERFSA
jgi:hypothetical protein